MIIKERSIITWLLNPESEECPDNLVKARLSTPYNEQVLNDELTELNKIRKQKPNFGLPELLMPSFVEVMRKSAPAFDKVFKNLLHEFSTDEECGILLQQNATIVYGFGDDTLYVWNFVEKEGKSVFTLAYSAVAFNDHVQIQINEKILMDDMIFRGTKKERLQAVLSAVNTLVVYVAVKKYVKVETIVIPQGVLKDVDDTPLQYVEKKKVINQLGQEVIVMDSKWFRKIINDNDIQVRGFFRMQNKKNADGEWFKELIFVEPFIRHGYHRDAIIEKETND